MGNKITRRRPVIDERYTRPQGLYPTRDVDQKKLRRLIIESKLAPCYPGAEETATDLEECPICFLHYPSLNRSKCCTKGVCTECFLQMKTPHAARPTQCPFCKTPQYAVEYRGAKTLEEKGMEQAEEQKVIEAKIRMRQQELQDDEEREQRREEDIRAGRIRLQTPRAQPHTNRQSQVHSISAPLERDTAGIDPYSLWVEGDYQREGDFDAAAPSQQSAVPRLSNTMSPVNQQQNEIDFSIPRFPPGAPRARHREEEFDLDLEDIMVMEAIWLSIQEQGAHHRFTEAEAIRPVTNRPSGLLTEISLDSEADVLPPPPPPVPELEPWEQRSGRQGTNTGSLAGAIAALAERQTVGDTDTATASQPTILSTLPSDFEVDHSASEISNVAEVASGASENTGNESERLSHNRYHSSQAEAPQRVEEIDFLRMLASTYRQNDAEKSSRASEKLANWVSSTQREYKSSSVGDHSSEQVEVGTSFASSVPSASELPWEAPEIPSDARNGESSGQGANNKKRLLPESFEEQMMLAMALSIADVQAARVRQGDNRSGPLPQPAYIGH